MRRSTFVTVVVGLVLLAATVCPVHGTQPLVAIHDSECTRALENQNASGATPTGANTTGKQWWPTDWHYFVMPEAIKEALRSDGTAFTVVGDSNIIAGALLTNGTPKYPIVISLAAEAIHDSQIASFTNYVAAGGFLFVGSSAFTRNTNGTTRGDFAFANEMGIHMVTAALTNWALNSTYAKVADHRIQTHVPGGTISWRLPSSSEEIPYGVSPGPLTPHDDEQAQQPHDVWQVVNSNATVLAQGQATPFLTIRAYGKGYFIYCAAMQPLLGNGGWAPTMYNYLTFRRSIEWAFENAGLPVAKLSPWPYPYDAAFMVRHDLESFSNAIAAVEASAQFEFTNGCTGDYYFCTGTLRENMSPVYNTNDVVTGLRRAMTNYGATIGPHNGGLTNPMIMGTPNSYDYWHWGPDEVLDISPPPGYSSGSNYAFISMQRSFQDIESWLPGLMTNGMRVWCGPYYNSTREASLNIQAQLGVKVTGEQKVAPFPHWTLSTQTPNKRFGILQQPPSDWFVGPDISHSIEAGHTIGTLRSGIDYYYNLGALLNFYSHTLSTGLGRAGPRATEYVTYSMDTNRFPRLWSANAIKIYNWWQQRSNVQMTASITTNGTQINTAFTIKNSTHTNTTIELTPPLNTSFCNLQVFTNGALAGANLYRLTGSTIKIRVDTTVTNALVSYYPLGGNVAALAENFDAPSAPSLPAGWTSSATGAQVPWVSQAANADSPLNSVFVGNPANVGVSELVSPVIAVSAGQAQLTFRNNYDLENGIGGIGYDGGVLEIKIGAGSFTDILAAGGTFVSGGYNVVIDNGFASPIAGRPAWSGSSGGYLTTTVSLPVLTTNQNIQLRWRCATDNGGSATGWRIDTISLSNRICLCCLTGTNTPVLPAQTNRFINELSTLTVTNTATDADVGETLFYALQNPPAGAIISGSGIITWTPSTAFGGTTNPITTIVTDGTDRKATNSFNVIVLHVNTPPALPGQSNRTTNESVTLVITNTASDSDLPANTLSYSLLVAPSGASISASGIITWPITEAQGPGNYTLTTRVEDNGTPALSATNTFTVTVAELNSAPILPGQGNRTINEATALVVTNTASDGDLPANPLSYQLVNPPAGAAINSSGVITWTPTETAGPSTNTFTTIVSDGAASDTNSFLVTVNDVLSGLTTNVTLISTGSVWSYLDNGSNQDTAWRDLGFNASGWSNGPAQLGFGDGDEQTVISFGTNSSAKHITTYFRRTFSIANASLFSALNLRVLRDDGVVVYLNGIEVYRTNLPLTTITYQTLALAAIGGVDETTFVSAPLNLASLTNGTNIVAVEMHQNSPSSSDLSFDLELTGVVTLVAPTLADQTNRTIPELTTLTVTNTATDLDTPANALTYQLVNAPGNAAINGSGVITWTPQENEGPGSGTLTTVVSDGIFSATNSFVVTVTEANQSPVLSAQTNRSIVELTLLTVTNTATDGDLPANGLTYQLLNAPGNAAINGNGVITWTPQENEGPGGGTITTVVSDGTVSVTNSFVVTVTEVNQAPVLPVQTNRTIAELMLLTVTNTATDGDLPANALTYQLLNAPGNAAINASGVITWTPQENEGPGSGTIITVVSDGTVSITNSFVVTVTEVNQTPVLLEQTNRSIAELTLLTVTNTATDGDLPANALTYQLVNPPGNATINSSGVITWTPQENEGPGSGTITTVVSDGTVSVTNSFVVTVAEANQSPVLPVQTNRTIAELSLLTVTNTATDGDLPANTLSYQLLVAPVGINISGSGVISWTPNEAAGPGTNTVTTVVTDGTASVTNTFQVIVTEANTPPLLNPIGNRTVHAGGMVSFTATASDADVPAQTLDFSLLNTPPAGAGIASGSGLFEWLTTNADVNTTNTITVRVADSGVPVLSTNRSFVVTVIARPQITNLVRTNGVVAVTWSSIAGQQYRLQRTDTLLPTNWQDVGLDVTAPGSFTTQTNATSGLDVRFYRVRLAP